MEPFFHFNIWFQNDMKVYTEYLMNHEGNISHLNNTIAGEEEIM